MDKNIKIFLWLVAIGAVLWLLWNFVFKPKPKCKTCNGSITTLNGGSPDITNGDGNGEPSEGSETKSALGETRINVSYDKSYANEKVNNYYLTYTSAEGEAEIEEITGSAYLRFMKDYPDGTAKGNVIFNYKN